MNIPHDVIVHAFDFVPYSSKVSALCIFSKEYSIKYHHVLVQQKRAAVKCQRFWRKKRLAIEITSSDFATRLCLCDLRRSFLVLLPTRHFVQLADVLMHVDATCPSRVTRTMDYSHIQEYVKMHPAGTPQTPRAVQGLINVVSRDLLVDAWDCL